MRDREAAIGKSQAAAPRMAAWLFDAASAPWILPHLQRRRATLVLLFLLGLVSALAALAPPYLTKLVIDQGLIAGDRAALIGWSLAFFAFGLLTLALSALNSVLHMRASVAMLADLRKSLAEAVLARSPAWRARRRTGELMSRIDGDAGEVQQFAFNALLTGSGGLLRLVGGLVMLFFLSWQLALLALLLVPLELGFFTWARPKTEALAKVSRAARGHFAARLAEMLGATGQIQAARAEAPIATGLANAQEDLNRALIRAQLWGEVTRAAPLTLVALVRGTVFLVGGLMVIENGWPLGSLIAFVAYLGFLVGPIQSLIGLWHAQARVQAALERLNAVMDAGGDLSWPRHPAALPSGEGQLRLEGVAVDADGKRLLSHIDLELAGGSKVRIAGPSGLGKTSLLSLLQRHADPAEGRLVLDGIDLRQLSAKSLRQAVALVPQRPFLIQGTVAENLSLSRPDANTEEMEEMLTLVGLDQRFAKEGGLAARLGEDGLTVSGGERQRLCLARALLTPFRILVLDEALSEVDPETVRQITRTLDQRFGDRTRLIATHGDESLQGPFDQSIDLKHWSSR